jgi:hypothetical protein
VFGPLAITYNLSAIDNLILDGPTLAKIFNGTITRWDDHAISAFNASMPSEPIHVVFRSDSSGTTDNFQQYLDAASGGAWGKGTGKTVTGGVGQGAKGNEGTSAAIKDTEGAIAYNEWSFAQDQRLFSAKIITSAGGYVLDLICRHPGVHGRGLGRSPEAIQQQCRSRSGSLGDAGDVGRPAVFGQRVEAAEVHQQRGRADSGRCTRCWLSNSWPA